MSLHYGISDSVHATHVYAIYANLSEYNTDTNKPFIKDMSRYIITNRRTAF